ncbi:MAG: integration host factor subunit alpha [bacterium]|nr:integration host factor subunit alpha [bacterium]
MTLTKSLLIDAIAEQNGFSKKKSTETVETILEIKKSTLVFGKDVLISGFGKSTVSHAGRDLSPPQWIYARPARVVCHPPTGLGG